MSRVTLDLSGTGAAEDSADAYRAVRDRYDELLALAQKEKNEIAKAAETLKSRMHALRAANDALLDRLKALPESETEFQLRRGEELWRQSAQLTRYADEQLETAVRGCAYLNGQRRALESQIASANARREKLNEAVGRYRAVHACRIR